MKILVLSSVYPRHSSDSEVPWLRESLNRLRSQGVKVQVLAPRWKGLASHEIDGIAVQRFAYAPPAWEILTHDEGAPSKMANKPWMQLLAIPYILSGAWQCLLKCRRERPDVIHAHWPFPHGLIAWPAAKFWGIPLVLNFHGAELLLMRKHPWVKGVLRFLLGQSAGVLCNSSFTQGKIQAIKNIPVQISPYGTTVAYSAPSFKAETPFKVLFVGRHIERKGIIYLLQAAQRLAGHPIEIRIVGSGDQTASLQAYAQQHNLRNVVFLGKLSAADLQAEYAASHCFVLPAIVDSKGDTEGLGVVLIEAAEYGLVLVASQVGGIVDVVRHQETGLLVPEQDSQALAAALLQVSADPELRAKLIAGAQQHISNTYSWDRIIAAQKDFYHRILAAR